MDDRVKTAQEEHDEFNLEAKIELKKQLDEWRDASQKTVTAVIRAIDGMRQDAVTIQRELRADQRRDDLGDL